MQLRKDDFDVFRPGYERQVAEGFRPRGDLAPVAMVQPFDWGMDPFHDRNWSFQLQAWRMLDPIWDAFYGSDWSRLKSEVMPWVMDWYRYHVSESRESPFSWYDMSAGLRAQHLALIVHLHQQGFMPLGNDELAVVRALSELHVERLCTPGFIAMNNHGLFQLRGLRLLGQAWSGQRFARAEPAYSARMMKRLLDRQFDAHGVHVENSPDYHGLLLRKFEEIRPELFPGIELALSTMLGLAREVLPWLTFPDGSIANIGDSAGNGEALDAGFTPDHTLHCAAGEVWVRDLSSSGYAVVRSAAGVPPEDASMLIVKAQALSKTHAHADHLGMVLYHAGRYLLADSGKYTYNKDAWRDYFVSDRAHNVVGIAGEYFGPQDTTTIGPGLSGAVVSGETVEIEGEIVRREYFRHRRRIVYRPGDQLDVIDRIDARPGDAPVAYWHLPAGVDAEIDGSCVHLFANGSRLARISVADPGTVPHLVHGQTEPVIQGWTSRAYKAKVASTVVEFHAPADCRLIETTIALCAVVAVGAGKLPRSLSHGVEPEFPFVFVSDRAGVLPDGRTKRRVIVDLPAQSPDAAMAALTARLKDSGFKHLSSTSEDDVRIRVFTHPDRTRLSIRATPGTAAAPARLAFSWLRMLPPKPKAKPVPSVENAKWRHLP